MKPSVQRLYDRYYPVVQDGIRPRDNGTRPFYQWIRSADGFEQATVLNLGAGPTPEPHRRLRGEVRHLVGVDVDPIVLINQDLDEAHVTDGVLLPFADRTFDIVYSDWTVEHVDRPVPFLLEVHRVLKSGGLFFFRTTNLTHYVTLVSAYTPHWVHRLIANRVRGISSHAPWPTFYRMNTSAAVRRNLAAAGFAQIEVQLIESAPAYLVFSPTAFRLGVLYERLVNRGGWWSRFRLVLMARARA